MNAEWRSRPMRLAEELRPEADERGLESSFAATSVAVRLEDRLVGVPDAHTTFLAIVNQVLRFCPNVLLVVDDEKLEHAALRMSEAIHGADSGIRRARPDRISEAGAVINVGVEIGMDPSWTTVNSTGWVVRAAPGGGIGRRALVWSPAPSNPLGALAAACFGAGAAFLEVAGVRRNRRVLEFSLFEGRGGGPGAFAAGPRLPEKPLEIDGLLVGCGGVANGWADAIRRLPVVGRLAVVDRQSLRIENMGPYVLAKLADLGRPKTEILSEALASAISMVPYPEEFELFKLRLRFGMDLPPLVVGGLDNVETRHSIQRLWPSSLIDMAAGGTTAQVLVHLGGVDGQCLLGAMRQPSEGEGYAQRVSSLTGLRPERILEGPTTSITAEDVAAAPPELRKELESARISGQLLCGRITERNLFAEESSDDFAPAAPFVSAFAGTVGAAETMKVLMGHRPPSGLHQQFDFLGGRGRRLVMRCSPSCECPGLRRGASA